MDQLLTADQEVERSYSRVVGHTDILQAPVETITEVRAGGRDVRDCRQELPWKLGKTVGFAATFVVPHFARIF